MIPRKRTLKRRRSKLSKETSLLKNLTKAFINLTEIEKQKLQKSVKSSLPKISSVKIPSQRHTIRIPSLKQPSVKKFSLKKPSVKKFSLKKPSVKKFSLKISPVKVNNKKKSKTRKMKLFGFDKKFINRSELLKRIKKNEDKNKKENKKQIDEILKMYNKKEKPRVSKIRIKPVKISSKSKTKRASKYKTKSKPKSPSKPKSRPKSPSKSRPKSPSKHKSRPKSPSKPKSLTKSPSKPKS
jgi:hypothetical protein